ncbi:MAG: restriction endonuclease, partial [Candidatus Poribacteria bacterium]|nr:restriction endonuclease [Candidatus Poribacteria bacterium]
MAEEQLNPLVEYLENHLGHWDGQGVPRPLARADEDHVFLVWHHQRFSNYSDANDTIDSNFCEIFRYLQTLNGTQFLVICAIWMKIAGFDEIYICDSRGDSGVDLLGAIENGGLRSLVAAVQAKTSSSPIGEGVVVTECNKYKLLSKSARYSE